MKFKKKTSQQVNGTQVLTPPPNKTMIQQGAATDRVKHVAVNPEACIAILELDSRSLLKPGPATCGQPLCLSLDLT